MNARSSVFRTPHRSGSPRRAVCFPTLVALAALAILTASAQVPRFAGQTVFSDQQAPIGKQSAAPGTPSDEPSSPPGAWGEAARNLILDETVARLPEPLRGLFATPDRRRRLREAVAADAAAGASNRAPADSTPDRERGEWAGDTGGQAAGGTRREAADALDALTTALAGEGPDAVFAAAARLARSAVGLHMPFHTAENADGAQTGNHGVAGAVGVGLIARYEDAYTETVRQNRRPVRYLSEPKDRLTAWAASAHERIAPILEADTVARNEATYNPAQHPEDLENLDAAAARPYYEALKRELGKRGAPEAAALRDAAAHLADLLYTAWVQAGKPLSLRAAAAETDEPGDATSPYWLLVLAVGVLAILLWPRRKPDAGDESQT
jgi:hypothetical protein